MNDVNQWLDKGEPKLLLEADADDLKTLKEHQKQLRVCGISLFYLLCVSVMVFVCHRLARL